MDKKALEKIKTKLLARKKNLEKSLKAMANENKKVKGHFDVRFPQYGNDKDANAQEISDFERLRALEQQQEADLKRVNQAINAIEEGKYGVCQTCSKPIREARLDAIPSAEFCIVCAGKVI